VHASLQTLVDREDIRDLNARFSHAIDNRDGELFASLWTEDGIGQRKNSEPRVQGRAALVEHAKHWPVDGRRLCTEAVLVVDGDQARQTIYCLYYDMSPPCAVSMVGQYEDKLVRTPKGWKFAERIFDPFYIRASELVVKTRDHE
jgi:hypothetical protein